MPLVQTSGSIPTSGAHVQAGQRFLPGPNPRKVVLDQSGMEGQELANWRRVNNFLQDTSLSWQRGFAVVSVDVRTEPTLGSPLTVQNPFDSEPMAVWTAKGGLNPLWDMGPGNMIFIYAIPLWMGGAVRLAIWPDPS